MAVYDFNDLRGHIGHAIVCVRYGKDDECVNVAVECETCGMVLFDLCEGEHYEKFVEETEEKKKKPSEKTMRELIEEIHNKRNS